MWESRVLRQEDIIENKAKLTSRKKKWQREKDVTINEVSGISNNSILKIEVNNEKLQIENTKEPQFLDIFKYVNFDTSIKKGDLIMMINEKPAEFTSPIRNGDRLVIYWSQEGIKKLERLK